MICYRQMVNTDCGQVAALLQENAQSRQGGLLGEYPLKKVENMFAHALKVVIAQDDDVIAGVVFSFPVQSAQISPVTAVISQQFGELLENTGFTARSVLRQIIAGREFYRCCISGYVRKTAENRLPLLIRIMNVRFVHI